MSGDRCLALGYPSTPELDSAEQRPSLRFGVITQNSAPYWFTSSYRFYAGVHDVFDFEGRLIGWNSKTPVGSDPIHVPADLLRSIGTICLPARIWIAMAGHESTCVARTAARILAR